MNLIKDQPQSLKQNPKFLFAFSCAKVVCLYLRPSIHTEVYGFKVRRVLKFNAINHCPPFVPRLIIELLFISVF